MSFVVTRRTCKRGRWGDRDLAPTRVKKLDDSTFDNLDLIRSDPVRFFEDLIQSTVSLRVIFPWKIKSDDISEKAPSKICSFKCMDKPSRFTRDLLLYSALIIEKCGRRAKSAWRSGSPANKSRACPPNVDAGSNVIDVSESQ
jgi:hypothetical protein